MHPVFLRFAILCVGIHALLDESHATDRLIGWQLPVLWLSMALAVILGYVLIGGWMLHLFRKRHVRRLYTPFILLPIVMIAEMTRQGVVVLLQAGDWLPVPIFLMSVTQDFLVLLLMDMMHVQFVVPQHPLAQVEQQAETPAPAGSRQQSPPVEAARPQEMRQAVPSSGEPDRLPGDATSEPPVAPDAFADRTIVRIADRVFTISEIQSVRTEDHYLNVVTRTARSMVRAKLSDVAALHDGRYGVQVNRSQWVAFSAIASVRDEENGQITLELVNGDSATVSRTRRLMFMQLFNTQRAREP
ncbi:LytTR family DNA-binding domain-containing protein [Paragemmobacter ruber]|uniref:HTH LytTR-type domain-containing protein n=1 Tax=Paragemmobacter ruber TaxID=1985673 RepID=A0ABW9Y9L6_9RHOB|nr:LytTR family DNA-binding domain-containing protein [Rhodobacter ruber]NBE09087.1 hypothetical protein [Rhodobacter ruber]